MILKNSILIPSLYFLMILFGCTDKPIMNQGNTYYRQKVDSLLAIMTVDEKIGQLNLLSSGWDVTGPTMNKEYKMLIQQGRVGAVFNTYGVKHVSELQRLAVEETRLGIPLLFGYDVIHGHRTIFPIPLAQACSWDLSMIETSDSIAASEASADGINWAFGPMVDISRDPRWGRVSEGAGEDTWLGSKIAAARVKGFQGNSLAENNTVLACVKHFAAYGAPQAGRDYHTVDMSERSLFEYYLPPYQACIDAGAGSIMTSFNEISGVPSTSNRWLFTELLRNTWGFQGFAVTDYSSIYELTQHGVAADSAMAGELALNAGIDMDMQSNIYHRHLKKSLQEGTVSLQEIDKAVRRILLAKYQLGLFDDPYKYCNVEREKNEMLTETSKEFARKFVTESCVLLKNKNNTLPIPKTVKKIFLIGPLGHSKIDMLGNWSAAGLADNCISLYDGLLEKAKLYGFQVEYLQGCDVLDENNFDFTQAIKLAKSADFVILALGEYRDMSGEAASRTKIGLPGMQQELANALVALGKPLAVVLFNGRPLVLNELDEKAPAILEAWFGGIQSGNGIADLLFADAIPKGKITMTFPRTEGQIPIHYNMKNTGRPVSDDNPEYKFKSRYIDCANEPLYPFGYGLSYTTFDYQEIEIDKKTMQPLDTLTITAQIANTGNFDGTEIVQLYIQDLVGSVTRPVKELKGFKKIHLMKGEKAMVTFKITANDLRFYDLDMNYVFEPGLFKIYLGPNSATGLTEKFELNPN